MARRPLTTKNADNPAKDQKQAKKESYPFRVMPREDLVDNLNQVLLQSTCFPTHSVMEEDLKNPTAQKVQLLYLACLNVFFGVLPDDFRQAAFEECPVEHPDLHEESFGNLRMFYAIRKMMETCLVKDFGVSDVFNPAPRRTVCNFSAIINFFKYHFCSYFTAGRVAELEAAKQDLEQGYREALARCDSLQARYAELHARRKEEAEREKELKEQIRLQEQALEELRAKQEALQRQYQVVSSGKVAKDKVLLEHRRELEKWTSRVDDLTHQVVPSPEKLNTELCAARESMEETKGDVRRCEDQLLTAERLNAATRQVPPIITGLDEDLGSLLAKSERRADLQKRLEDTQENIGTQKLLLREAAAKYGNLAHRLKLVTEEAAQMEYEPRGSGGGGGGEGEEERMRREVLLLQGEMRQRPSVVALQEEAEERRGQLRAREVACTAVRQGVERTHAVLQSAFLKLKATADQEWPAE